MRITNQAMVDRMLTQIGLTQQRLSETQMRVGSGLRISRPSDDPYGTSRLMAARSELERIQQFDRNISVALSDLSATETALTRFSQVLERASELSIQAATGSMDGSARAAIALEISELLDEAIAVGNSSNAGSYLFAGQRTDTPPFVPDVAATPTVVNYVGDTGTIERELAPGSRIAVNITGDRIQIFDALIKLRDDLLANDSAALDLDTGAVEMQLDTVLELRSEIGSKMRRVEMAQSNLDDEETRVRILISEIEEVDLAETIVELQMQETAYQAALGSAGRTLGLMSLMDFLR